MPLPPKRGAHPAALRGRWSRRAILRLCRLRMKPTDMTKAQLRHLESKKAADDADDDDDVDNDADDGDGASAEDDAAVDADDDNDL